MSNQSVSLTMRAQVRMYTAIAKAMIRSCRTRKFPAHIPASQSQTLPPQRRAPAIASVTQIDILYLSFILSDFF